MPVVFLFQLRFIDLLFENPCNIEKNASHNFISSLLIRDIERPHPKKRHRRPLPVPHKNFRIIFVSTGSPENRARDEHRSFGMGESTLVWWRPVSVSVPKAVAEAPAVVKGRQTGDRDLTMDSCRNEIVQELVCSTAAGDCRVPSTDAGLEMVSENFAR